jgi:signal transduction histidine kinase
MKFNLGAKLFISYLGVLVVGVVVLAIVAQISLPGAYGRHLGLMNQMMGPSGEMVQGGRWLGNGAGQDLFSNFKISFFEALGWASFAALIVALVLSLVMSRRLTAPLRTMTIASQRIAEGRYSERVPSQGNDELGQMATAFNTMTEKLEKVESMRRRLIGDIAHELRTPLTFIKGSMEGLVDGVLPASPETYEQVARETDRLSRLVDDLQELSRVEAASFSLELSPVSISELVETVRKRLSRPFLTKGITLSIHLADEIPLVQADTGRLLQVLTNLLNNALQYTPTGGEVTLNVKRNGQEICVTIADTGIGIPPLHLPHIFDRFYRVDKSRSRQEGGGSGIGLTISKYLVEAHGGRIWVESNKERQGSKFIFTLPVR